MTTPARAQCWMKSSRGCARRCLPDIMRSALWHSSVPALRRGRGDTGRALDYINEGVNIDEQAANRDRAGGQFLPDLLTERAVIEIAAGQLSSAERDAREAIGLLQSQAHPGDFSSSNGRAYLALARVLGEEGRTAEARTAAQTAGEQLQQALGAQHPDTLTAEQFSRANGEAPNQ